MLKAFLLVLIFEPSAGQTALHHMEFASRQSCEAAKVLIQSKAKQTRPGAPAPAESAKGDNKGPETLKLIEATCLEK